MFDQKPGSPSGSDPQDIFDSVEPPENLPVANAPRPMAPPAVPTSSAPRPTAPTMAPRPMPAPVPRTIDPSQGQVVSDRHVGTGGHVWKTVLVVIIAFLAMGGAAFIAYKVMTPAADQDQTQDGDTAGDNDEDEDLPDGKGGSPEEDIPPAPAPEPEPIVLDTDGDGLTDDDERAAGTDVAKTDTDSDLLGDREELQVYGTDPLREDTDGDGFSDGEEVRSGYNPNGPGKLLEIPTSE